MNTLSGELGEGVAQAQGVGVVLCGAAAVADVSHTGAGEGGNIQQSMAAGEGGPCEYLLAQGALEDRGSRLRINIGTQSFVIRSGSATRELAVCWNLTTLAHSSRGAST